jgi:hypothetical protein
MPRVTKHLWCCGMCKQFNAAHLCKCDNCGTNHHEKNASIHASERAVVYYNPETGEHRTPPRSDQPVPEVYAAQGFERREIHSMIEWEREAGVVHEATNFHPGNEDTPLDPRDTNKCPTEVKQALIEDMKAAFASGPWTGDLGHPTP